MAGTPGVERAPPLHSPSALWLPAAIALVVIAAFANGLNGVFLLDDEVSLLENTSLRSLSDLRGVLFPPAHVYTAGRPLLNLTFALNYAAGGLDPRGYHAINIVIHAAAAMVLFGITRRLLRRGVGRPRSAVTVDALAVAVSLLWALHPLQTNAVTYVSQRAESLMGLCYLSTLYAVVRCAEFPGARWMAVAIVSCGAGMMTKETMVTAPVVALLFDAAFLAGSLREAWRQRGRLYLGLAATWLVLGALMFASGLATRSVGYDSLYSASAYLQIECVAVVHYLRLALWPWPLVFDYGAEIPVPGPAAVAICAALLVSLAMATIWVWRRNPPLSFPGAWWFIVLAPTSSFVPVAGQPIAESRLYLPLAAVAVGLAFVCTRVAGRRAVPVLLLAAGGLGAVTAARNTRYHSALGMWEETVTQRPGSARAHAHHGAALVKLGRLDDGIAALEAALRIRPRYAEPLTNLATALGHQKRFPEAIQRFEEVLHLTPDSPVVHLNFATTLLRAGRPLDALRHYDATLRLEPSNLQARFSRALALKGLGRLDEAITAVEALLRDVPGNPDLIAHLGEWRTLQKTSPRP